MQVTERHAHRLCVRAACSCLWNSSSTVRAWLAECWTIPRQCYLVCISCLALPRSLPFIIANKLVKAIPRKPALKGIWKVRNYSTNAADNWTDAEPVWSFGGGGLTEFFLHTQRSHGYGKHFPE